MSQSHGSKRRVFILGAGFSAKAGIPLTNQLLPLSMNKFSQECSGLYERVNNYAAECTQTYGADTLDYSKIDFSDFCTFLEYIELREHGGGERWSDAGSREKLALKFYLSKTIAEKTPEASAIPQLYLDFANCLQPLDIVISFNWDCLLEKALIQANKPFTYNFKNDSAIKLIKLHGSINWRLEQHKGHNSKTIDTLNWSALEFTEGMADKEVYCSDHLFDFNKWSHYSPLGEVEPFIVLPGYGKAFDVRFLSSLWYKPEFAFFGADDVYIIGLSLSRDDFFIRSYFLSNLPYIFGDNKQDLRRVMIINPDKKTHDRYDFAKVNSSVDFLIEEFSAEHIDLINQRHIRQ